MREINDIIIHSSNTQENLDIKAETIRRWHVVCNGWKDCGFHYIIDLDGTIEPGRRVSQIGAHCKEHNTNSIGICYIGGRDKKMQYKDTRTKEQKLSLYRLIERLLNNYNLTLDNVHCHYEYNNSELCPSFKKEDFVKEYKLYLKNNNQK